MHKGLAIVCLKRDKKEPGIYDRLTVIYFNYVLYVESYVQDVAVLYYIILAFYSEFAGFFHCIF